MDENRTPTKCRSGAHEGSGSYTIEIPPEHPKIISKPSRQYNLSKTLPTLLRTPISEHVGHRGRQLAVVCSRAWLTGPRGSGGSDGFAGVWSGGARCRWIPCGAERRPSSPDSGEVRGRRYLQGAVTNWLDRSICWARSRLMHFHHKSLIFHRN